MSYVDILDKEVFRLAKLIPEINPEPFIALEEYDKTRKLKKWATKTRANFTLDGNLLRRFRKHCSEKNQKMSSVLEKLISEELAKKH